MVTEACRTCEDWHDKDLLYVVGVAPKGKLSSLWFVYGDCYAANKIIYERIKDVITTTVRSLDHVEFSETNELARVNRVDPLGITYLRVRGMWHIDNPSKVFEYLASQKGADFSVCALLLEDKYQSLPSQDRLALETLNASGFSIRKVQIKSPNNPIVKLDARFIEFRG